MLNYGGVAYTDERDMLQKCSLTPAFLSFVLEASRHKRLAELDFTGCWRVGGHTNHEHQLGLVYKRVG